MIGAGRRRRRRRGRLRLAAVAVIAGAAIAVVAVVLLQGTPPRQLAAERFAADWARGADAAAYAQLRRGSVSYGAFTAALHGAASTATLSGASVTGPAVGGAGGVYRVPVRERTRAFGTLRESARDRHDAVGGDRLEPGARVRRAARLARRCAASPSLPGAARC